MKRIHAALAGLTLFISCQSLAFTPDLRAIEDPALFERFPPGSIVTREKADHALHELGIAKRRLKELADYSARRCQENIFVNSCIEDVRRAKMRQERRLLAIETEARQYVRADNTRREAVRQAERDRRAATPPPPPKTAKPRNDPNATQRAAQKRREDHARRQAQVERRQAEHRKKEAQQQANRLEQQKKVREREERRRERAQRVENRRQQNQERRKDDPPPAPAGGNPTNPPPAK